ncbi:MAG TPA: ATP-binding cassette domain-containing protein [Clostridia bacterium]|nr:ATP-binding cassette domain-containing protein [Clostridia bacterium]
MIHDRTRILIRAEGLCKRCRTGNGAEEAVSGLDLIIRQGELVVIKGISGTRKIALFNLLGCLERPDSGKYYFDYEDIALAEDETLEDIRRRRIGYLFRDFRLIDRLTVCQNVEVPMSGMDISREEKARRAAEALADLGIEKISGEKVSSLSDYDRQLAALARATVNGPLMIMADEPAAALDAGEAARLMERLRRLNEEGTAILLFSSGDIPGLRDGLRVITFEKGIACGNGGAI